MQHKMTARWMILILIVAALSASSGSNAQAARPKPASAPTDVSASIIRLAALVRNEYMEEIPAARLVAGAYKGVRSYLKKNGCNPSVVADPRDAQDIGQIRAAFATVAQKYPRISQKHLSYAAIRGMLEGLGDPYTVFLDPEEYKSLMSQLNGENFGGLGIFIEADDKNGKVLTVVEPMEGTPAMRAGIKPRDVILEIDAKSTQGMTLDDATRLLRGPVGSTVTLTIKRPGTAQPFKVPVVRAIIHSKSVVHKILDGGKIGYIKLRVFGETANEEMEDAFRVFDEAGVKAYILDLRNNGGGYITAALDVSSKFLSTGSRVVSVAERGASEIVYNSRPNLRDILPVVVLVNKYSASASEITAGALKDLHSGILIGEKTFGKGSVQKIFPLPDGSALKITTAHYKTPSGQDIHKKGIAPDVAVPMDLKDVGGGDRDLQLKAAVALLDQRLSQKSATASRGQADLMGGGRADAIAVRTSEEEFSYIRGMRSADGGSYQVEDQSLLYENGRYYDRVQVRGTRGGDKKTLYFRLDYFGR